MPRRNHIITTGTALVLCPVLARHFGKSAALVLQQLHYWLSKENLSYGIIDDGRQWIRNSYSQWQKQIQFLSISTIRRAFSELESKNITQSECFDEEENTYVGGSQVKYFTICYDQLEAIIGDLTKTRINRPAHFAGNHTGYKNRAGGLSPKTIPTQEHTPVQNNAKSAFKRPAPLFKMNTLPVQNEHPPKVYISKTTSENTSLSFTAQPTEANQHQRDFVETIQPDKPAEREKINCSDEMIRLWNAIVAENKPDRMITTSSKRNQHLNAAFKQFFESNLAHWETFCYKITTCKFLMGEINNFKASIDWAIRFDTIQKINEGAYTFGTRKSTYVLTLSGQNKGNGDVTTTSTQQLPSNIHESEKATMIRTHIKRAVNDDAQYRSWFLPTEIIIEEHEGDHDRAILCVSTQFMASRIQTHFRDIYEHYFDAIFIGSGDAYRTKAKNQPRIHVVQPSTHDVPLSQNSIAETFPTIIKHEPVDTLGDNGDVQAENPVLETHEPEEINITNYGNDAEQNLRQHLCERIGAFSYSNWFAHEVITIEEGRTILTVSSSFVKNLLHTNYAVVLDDFFAEVRVAEDTSGIVNEDINNNVSHFTEPRLPKQLDPLKREISSFAVSDVDTEPLGINRESKCIGVPVTHLAHNITPEGVQPIDSKNESEGTYVCVETTTRQSASHAQSANTIQCLDPPLKLQEQMSKPTTTTVYISSSQKRTPVLCKPPPIIDSVVTLNIPVQDMRYVHFDRGLRRDVHDQKDIDHKKRLCYGHTSVFCRIRDGTYLNVHMDRMHYVYNMRRIVDSLRDLPICYVKKMVPNSIRSARDDQYCAFMSHPPPMRRASIGPPVLSCRARVVG